MLRLLLTFIMIFFLIPVSIADDGELELHTYYEQNGDCYILIGEGNETTDHTKTKAVWALNNTESAGSPEMLYSLKNPYFEAYGLTAFQKWDITNNISNKEIFTFAGEDGSLTDMYGKKVPRRIVTTTSTTVHAYTVVPEHTVHNFHGAVNAGPTGMGNHPWGTINSLFGGIDYPCSVAPVAVSGRPGYYWYPVGQGFYHAKDIPVWSNWTYTNMKKSLNDPPPVSEQWNPQTQTAEARKGPWVVCCAGSYPGNGWIHGGWVRRMVREHLREVIRDLTLYRYRRDVDTKPLAYDPGDPDNETPTPFANIQVRVEGTMDLNGECCDGCIRAVSNVPMAVVESPHLSCVYSALTGRSYLYNRAYGTTDYSLAGIGAGDQIIGSPGDLTCQHLGISSKDANSNYVYALGKNEINKWMTEANVPEAMKIQELTDVAVSDQWWQKGGIVYAYDATKGRIYSFTRNEKESIIAIPNEIDVSEGGKLDAIGADGFGSLYMLRTEYDPPETTAFTDTNMTRRYATSGSIADMSNTVFEAEYTQKVYKSVYTRSYDTGIVKKENTRILLGINKYTRRYIDENNDIDAEKPNWVDTDYTQSYPIIDASIRSELSVINSPTPPRPSSINAVVDCNGPMFLDAGFTMASPGSDGSFTSDKEYWFLVENAPYFDINELNIGNAERDVDGDSRIGRFPNTIQKSSLKYHWKIIRTHDREGSPVRNINDPENIIVDISDGSYLFLFPSVLEGTFRIGTKVTYSYYDYSQLTVGSLASDREDTLVGGKVAAGEDADNYAWSEIKMKVVPQIMSPTERGIIMAGIDAVASSSYKPGGGLSDYGCDGCNHVFCTKDEKNPESTTFIMDGHSLVQRVTNGDTAENADDAEFGYATENVASWGLMLRETKFNILGGVNRIASMTSIEPPLPNDSQLVPGTLKWADELRFTWSSELKRGNEVIFSDAIVTKNSFLTRSELRRLMPMPSEPLRYTIKVSAERKYMYEHYRAVPTYAGGQLTGSVFVRVPKTVDMKIWGDCEICVTDNTPPSLLVYNPLSTTEAEKVVSGYTMINDVLYGTTSEPITPSVKSNPDKLIFIVVDNNPMANGEVTSVLSKGDTCSFHYDNNDDDDDDDTIKLIRKRLKVSFTPTMQKSIFHYDCENGSIPTADSEMVASYTLKPIVSVELAAYGIPYYPSLSYQKYEIPVSNMQHFSKTPGNAWSPNLGLNHATNKPGYSNYLFGLSWQEACHASGTNNLNIDAPKKGHIVIIDNDRPNAFISAVQDKYPDEELFSPTGLDDDDRAKWKLLKEDQFNGRKDWFFGTGGNIKEEFGTLGLPDTTVVDTNIFTASFPLEVNVPVAFYATMFDNIGSATPVSFELYASGDSIPISGFGVSDVANSKLNASGTSTLRIQYSFKTPGDYYVSLVVEDNRLGWPSDYLKPTENTEVILPDDRQREVRAHFRVVPSRLRLRIIERQDRGF